MPVIDSQVHVYEANTPDRPWATVPNWPPRVNGEDMVAAMDAVGVDGAIFVSSFSMYEYDASYACEVQQKYPGKFALVKPIDPMELRAALDKASAHLERDRHVEHTNQMLSRVDRFGRLRLPTPNGFHLIPVHEIVYCESAGNYSTLVMSDGEEHAITRSLGQLEEELNSWFLRIHRCHLVNLRHVRTYLKGEGGQVVLSTGKALDVSRTRKQHLLMALAQDGQID